MLTIDHICMEFSSKPVLDDITFLINQRERVALVGKNGAGKTTLLRLLAGVETPTSGRISKMGDITIGYLPQVSSFDKVFPISVLEVVMSGLQAERGMLRRYGKAERERAMTTLHNAHLDHLATRPIGELSGGQLQRVMLCRAIISEPKLLVLDEPTNFVDNRFENELYNLLHHLSHEMAIMMVSHDVGTISSVVNNIVCVNRHVHRHDSNIITEEQLRNYDCPIQIISHGHIPHTVLEHHHH